VFVVENCAFLGCSAASSGVSLHTFRDNQSVPFSKVMNWRTWVPKASTLPLDHLDHRNR